MANNEFMALFGPDSFTANVFSEANAVKYRLVVRGANLSSTLNAIEVSINGADIINRNTQRDRGINLAIIDGTTLALLDYKTFDMYGDPTTNGNALRDYLGSLPENRIVCFYSYDAIGSNANFTAIMRKIGSVAWPEERFFSNDDRRRSSYSAIYSSTMKKICMENFVGGSGSISQDDTRSFVEVVFDEFSDIGVTGIPERMVDDVQTYQNSGSLYGYHGYGSWNIGTDVFRGDIFKVTGDLYCSQELRDAGGDTYLYIWTETAGAQWVASSLLRTTNLTPDTWHSLSIYFTIPQGTENVKMGCQVYHYPSTVNVGLSQCRNVQISKVPREEVNRNGAAIGVNGVRMQTLSEVDTTGTENPIEQLLSLPVSPAGTPSNKTIVSHNFAELDYLVADPTEYTSTDTTQYLVKEWANKQYDFSKVSLSSVGAKPGDVIRVAGQLKRDATAIANNKRAFIIMQFLDANNQYIGAPQPVIIQDVSTVPNVYTFYKSEGVVPDGAVNFDFGFYRYPSNTNTGSMSVKDVKLSIVR
ncbi:tail fiber hinge [Buttiauxella phage vB_ButM_GuL6]|nr:tail fiber hinge [Buttiauxella phage vB_ButM_GuL6]